MIINKKRRKCLCQSNTLKEMKNLKKMIVNLCETSSDKTMSDIAREYGVSRTNITNWRKKYGTVTTSTGEVTNNDEILKL